MYKNVNINESDLNECRALADRCREEAKKRLVGQSQVIDGIITAFVAGGHVLLEGVPGLAKTLAVKTFAEISGLSFKRIQFTPDLLPADLTGTLIYEQSSGRFSVRKGPVFTNVVFADEINRAPAKVQSALLEAMAEGQVTIGETSYRLPEPFFVLATQNPIEQEGTYNLPEAELDRFLMKIIVPYPTAKEEVEIVKTCGNADSVKVSQIFDERSLSKCRSVLENIVCDDKIIEYIVSIVNVTRPSAKNTGEFRSPVNFSKANDDIIRYITYGVSP
ncbi:MAG: AAA family ATPase, partial [Treponema sp.]